MLSTDFSDYLLSHKNTVPLEDFQYSDVIKEGVYDNGL